jgi:iron(III) transport system permease protein
MFGEMKYSYISGNLLSAINPWTSLVVAIALIIAIPVLFVLSSIFTNAGDTWNHLATTVLPQYITNSLWLMVGVGIGVVILGVGTAWLVTICRFPGSRIFEWALLLPMAAPAYILAYTYTNFLEFFGPVQTTLRNIMGWTSMEQYWFPNIRSLGGAIAMLILVLYPYVYLLTRVAFLEQSVQTLEASRSLGCNPWQSFWKIALPLARPAIISGLALALMETLSDFGTVEYFGVNTFTTGIYRTWFGRNERIAASQLAAVLMLFIFVLLLLERWSRHQSRYYQNTSRYQKPMQYDLQGIRAILANFVCLIPIFLGFILPGGFLLQMTLANMEVTLNATFWTLAFHSLILAVITAFLGVAISIIMAYGQRLYPTLTMSFGVRIAAMGYAIPGSVIAVGVLIPIGQLDNTIDRFMQANFGVSTGLLFSGTIVALIFAYLVRFLAVSFGTLESGLSKIKPSLDEAASSLGHSPTSTLFKVHAPLMWGSLLTAMMLVFVDVMKELPATLVIRPFNFDTLAVKVYQYASDERLIEASAPALAIVIVGMIPVIFLSLKISQSRMKIEEI